MRQLILKGNITSRNPIEMTNVQIYFNIEENN